MVIKPDSEFFRFFGNPSGKASATAPAAGTAPAAPR
jgi:hypothetical protein